MKILYGIKGSSRVGESDKINLVYQCYYYYKFITYTNSWYSYCMTRVYGIEAEKTWQPRGRTGPLNQSMCLEGQSN